MASFCSHAVVEARISWRACPSPRAKGGAVGQFPSFPVGSGQLGTLSRGAPVGQFSQSRSRRVLESYKSVPLHERKSASSASSQVFQSRAGRSRCPSWPVFPVSQSREARVRWPSCLHKPNAAQSASSEVFQSGCLFCPAPSCPVFQFSSRNSAGLIDVISVNEGSRSTNYGSDADTFLRGLSQLRPALWQNCMGSQRAGSASTRHVRARW